MSESTTLDLLTVEQSNVDTTEVGLESDPKCIHSVDSDACVGELFITNKGRGRPRKDSIRSDTDSCNALFQFLT